MASTFTTNKGIEKPASGDYVNAWAAPINADWDDVDTALGGTTSISVTSVAAGTITLTLTQYRPMNIEFTGALTANLNYQIPTGVGGVWTISNATTGSSNTLQFSIAAGNAITLPANRTLIVSDGANISIADYATASTAAAAAQAAAIAAAEASAASLYAPASTNSFIATLTGMGSAVHILVTYYIAGSICTLRGVQTGISNSNSMTMTGLPSVCTPATGGSLVASMLEDNGNPIGGWSFITTGGTINFGTGINNNQSGFTASGTKGLPGGWCMTYSLF